MGSERAGLPEAMLERSDAVLGIPMYGINHSFPVAVAAGMVLFDWARRRYDAAGTTLLSVRIATRRTIVNSPPRWITASSAPTSLRSTSFPMLSGLLRVSLDGEITNDRAKLPEMLTQKFALLTAYNPRSMLLPRRVNEQRNQVMRDLGARLLPGRTIGGVRRRAGGSVARACVVRPEGSIAMRPSHSAEFSGRTRWFTAKAASRASS